jgi:hypothetical protein
MQCSAVQQQASTGGGSIVARQGLECTWRCWKKPKQFQLSVHLPKFAQLGLHAKLVKLWQQQQLQ